MNFESPLLSVYPDRKLKLVKGKGIYLFDEKGQKYLDLMSNYGVNIFGHSHPKISKALKRQISKLINLHSSFQNKEREKASQLLLKKCNLKDWKVFWTNSGSEAVEASLKFAAFFTKKKKFIAAKNSFHGKTLGALSATGKKEYREDFEPLLWEFVHVDFGKEEKIEEVIDENTAGVILEPIQGEGGVILPQKEYLKKVKEICEKFKALLILDEIQTGLGRTGYFLASHFFEVLPDIICLGKALGGGIPAGATLLKKEIAEKIKVGLHTSTFGGNPLACAGAIAVLELLDSKILSHVREIGEYFLEKLKDLKSEKIVEVRGKGLILAIELNSNATLFLKELQKRKILAIPAGKNVIRFLPPFIIGKKEVDFVVNTLKEIL
jgi:predicted acetylornithine/succinylornithine family transaminase